VVTETSPLAEDVTARVARLVQAERAAINAGGCALRLAGLYNLQRGPHNFWLTSSKPIAGAPEGLVNLLHYDDAASACLAALQAGPTVCRGRAFLISDGHPTSRHDICASARQAAIYATCDMPTFSVAADSTPPMALGKVYDGSVSNALLSWTPKYESFDAFMKANA
jgi:nucleoside-diphosphate-sugar epimerase